MYWKAITVIEAQQMLNQITVSVFPDMSKSDREKTLKDLNKKAYTIKNRNEKKLTNKELAAVLGVL